MNSFLSDPPFPEKSPTLIENLLFARTSPALGPPHVTVLSVPILARGILNAQQSSTMVWLEQKNIFNMITSFPLQGTSRLDEIDDIWDVGAVVGGHS